MLVGACSWLVSAVLLIDVWRRKEPVTLRVMFVLILLVPILGPFFYLWIRSFAVSNKDELVDWQRYELDVLNRWRDRFERVGWLPRRWSLKGGSGQGRDSPAHSESYWSEAQAAIAEAKARDIKRRQKQLRRARRYKARSE